MQAAQAVTGLGAPWSNVLCLVMAWFVWAAPNAHAQSSDVAIWISPGFYTVHFARDHHLRDPNPGLGLEYSLDSDTRLTFGRFINSDNAYSSYLGVYHQPWHMGQIKWGVAAGFFDGYPKAFRGGWFPAVLPGASWEEDSMGINLAFVPELKNRLYGGISLQFKYRLR